MKGWKDVVLMLPMGSVKFIPRFTDFANPDVPYRYHCHNLGHEDEGMMGSFVVVKPASATGAAANGSCPICSGSLPMPTGIDFSKVARAEIFDVAGRLVRVLEKGNFGGQPLDVSALPTGTYLMNMSDAAGKTLAVQRFFKN